MGAYEKEWARRKRAELLETLGGRCVWCGATEELTFDCIVPRGDSHHRTSTDQRMCFYRKEHRERRNVQILCHRCNSKKGSVVTFHETELPDLELPPLVVGGGNPF